MTYLELFNVAGDSNLQNRVAVACLVAAEAIRAEPVNTANHANRLLWAKAAFADYLTEGKRMLPAVLAQNKALTVAQVQAAADATIQTAVNTAVDVFATGG